MEIKATVKRAHKQHTCSCGCNSSIAIGQDYVSVGKLHYTITCYRSIGPIPYSPELLEKQPWLIP